MAIFMPRYEFRTKIMLICSNLKIKPPFYSQLTAGGSVTKHSGTISLCWWSSDVSTPSLQAPPTPTAPLHCCHCQHHLGQHNNHHQWDGVATLVLGQEMYRKIHPKWLCSIDSGKINPPLSGKRMYNIWFIMFDAKEAASHTAQTIDKGDMRLWLWPGEGGGRTFCLPFYALHVFICTFYPQPFKLQANCGDDGHSCHFLLCLPSSVQGCSLILDIELQDTYYIGGWCHVWWCEDKF